MEKKVLGLDLGTNSIGWALINTDENNLPKGILKSGSRIIPMSQDILGNFESGNSVSQTAERRGFRSIRRLRERHLLRRERLHRVLRVLGYLPAHYLASIDFEKQPGKFIKNSEPKLAWKAGINGTSEFLFINSFYEMVEEFRKAGNEGPGSFNSTITSAIPYDWTIYYLRKKALYSKISKGELAWIILNFNQKRGYHQLRGEDSEENINKLVEYHALKVVDVVADGKKAGKEEVWYNVHLENGWIYRRPSKTSIFDWKTKVIELIVTTDLNEDGSVKKGKDGEEKRSFRAPKEDDWALLKKKTENEIIHSGKTIGNYIYEELLKNRSQKIRGKLVRTIERSFYKDELIKILNSQTQFHPELNDNNLLKACISELYPNNHLHAANREKDGFTGLFIDDVIFYQRPLKSKKSLISNCKFEFRVYKEKETGEIVKEPLKCIPKSHPLFQEFRMWKFIKNLKIYQHEKTIDGKLFTDYDVTSEFLKTDEDLTKLFDWLSGKKEISQSTLFSSYFRLKKIKGNDKFEFRWNYIQDKKEYPCNETRALFISRLSKIENIPESFTIEKNETALWHILYSVSDPIELEKALTSFALKHRLPPEFVSIFKKFPPFKNEYGSYSEKAIKKLVSLMRIGKYWREENIHPVTRQRIETIINGEVDEKISIKIREKAINLSDITHFHGLPEWLASYIVYGRHSEAEDFRKWNSPEDIEAYLRYEFKQHSLRNPIVEQIISETLRVVKDIWKQYGDISEIHIELGREMKNPADERKRITQQVIDNENTNLRIKSLLAEFINYGDIENVRPYSPSQQEILKIYENGVLNSGIEIPEDIEKISKSGQPSKSEMTRYKLWLEQKYRSPYTGEMISLSKLFTSAYQIEHIIPQSRYFDDSLSNKVICESEINAEKDNQLGLEFIKNNEGRIIELSFGNKARIFTVSEYQDFVKSHYRKNPAKMKKLLLEDIPEQFIERQLNDTRYISKVIKTLLSGIVREKDEEEAISKNVIPCTGAITDRLKQDWGLNDVWNSIITPRFQRLNVLTNSKDFGTVNPETGKFLPKVPLQMQKGFNKKRIDHRHHAMDAIVIACATRNHINYLNNEHARQKDDRMRFDLRNKLRRIEEIEKEIIENSIPVRKKMKVAKEFHKPWDTFTQDVHAALENIIVSFKNNTRIINKTVNYYQHFVNGKKVYDKQTKGDNWAIRKSLHKDTVAGPVNLRFKKSTSLLAGIDQVERLVNKELKKKIKKFFMEGFDKKQIISFFSNNDFKLNGIDISKPEIYYFSNEAEPMVASRVLLDTSFNSSTIKSITDTGIQKILLNHLKRYNEERDGKIIEHPELAFTPEGIAEMNRNIVELNHGKAHQPIFKVRTYEPKGNKFNVGDRGNKTKKFVEADKGTNLFFAIYVDESGKRSYRSIPLTEMIERTKQGLYPVPELKTDNSKLLFYLNPNDLVMVKDEITNDNEIFKMVSCTGSACFFIPQNVSSPIVQTLELGANNKAEKSWSGKMIKQCCIKIIVDRLGNLKD